MADYAGIQAATATLRRIVLERSRVVASVTTTPPDVEDSDSDPPVANLFLYRVSENGALKNQDLPGRAGPASLGRPPLSLDLHYLLTVTGQTGEDAPGAQEALGDAMLVLHDHPIVAKDDPLLDPALEHEVELLKITLEDLELESLAGLWSATTSPYRLSAGYRVTVVQLESTRPRRIARPVGELPEAGPRVYALPLDRPTVAAVTVIRRLPDGTDGPERAMPHARVGDKLVVHGAGFAPGTRLRLGSLDATEAVQPDSTAERLVALVPDVLAGQPLLRPGVQRLQLARDVHVGESERALPVLQSNVASFVLVPTVTGADATASGDPSAGDPVDVTVTVEGNRLAAPGAPTFVLVGDRALPADVDTGALDGGDVTEVHVETRLRAGAHLVRVRAADAESLETDVEVVVG